METVMINNRCVAVYYMITIVKNKLCVSIRLLVMLHLFCVSKE